MCLKFASWTQVACRSWCQTASGCIIVLWHSKRILKPSLWHCHYSEFASSVWYSACSLESAVTLTLLLLCRAVKIADPNNTSSSESASDCQLLLESQMKCINNLAAAQLKVCSINFLFRMQVQLSRFASHCTTSSSAEWSLDKPPSSFINGHGSTVWDIVQVTATGAQVC